MHWEMLQHISSQKLEQRKAHRLFAEGILNALLEYAPNRWKKTSEMWETVWQISLGSTSTHYPSDRMRSLRWDYISKAQII